MGLTQGAGSPRAASPRPARRGWWLTPGAYAPVLAAPAVLAPRMVHARFGLLDDAVTLRAAQLVLAHPAVSLHAYESAGRFLPVYWLYWALCYALGGYHPAVFYAANALLLALTVAALIALMRKFQATAAMTWAAALWFLFSAAATDAYGTLSKGEPLALLCMLGSLGMAWRASRAGGSALYWLPAGALALAAAGTRETALALAGIVAGWWLLSWWRGWGRPVLPARRALAIYLAVLTAGLAPIFAARWILRKPLAAGAYAAHYRLNWETLRESGLLWVHSLARNFPELLLLLAAGAVMAWRKQLRQGQLPAMMLVWMAMTAGILLPWPHTDAYYDLAFTAGSSVFCGVMTGELLRMARGGRTTRGKRAGRWGARAVLAATAALGGILAADNLTFASSQIHVDEANADMLEALGRLPPHSVVLVNIPREHEYLFEIRSHLRDLMGRSDLRIEPLDFTAPDAAEAEWPHLVISLDMARQRQPLVRGPMTEREIATWKSYWEKSRAAADGGAVRQIGQTWQMADLDFETLWRSLRAGPGPVQPYWRPALDWRQSFYAWEIYPYPRWRAPLRAASFDRGAWTIEQPSGEPLRLAWGMPDDLPVAADWEGDGRIEPGVYRPSAKRWLIDRKLSGKPDLVFSVPGMQPGDLPVAGAWEGHGAGPGYYRPATLTWHLFGSPGSTEELMAIHWGVPGAIPVAGDWDGDGRATPGFYHPAGGGVILINELSDHATPFGYAVSPGMPVVVNWSGAGVDTVNTVKNGKWERRFANCYCTPSNAVPEFSTSLAAGQLFLGRWKDAR